MAARVITCPQCQAPLKWKGVAAVVECCYCNSNVMTGQKPRGQRTDRGSRGTLTQLPAQITTIRGAKARSSWLTVFILLFALGLPAAITFFVYRTVTDVFSAMPDLSDLQELGNPPNTPGHTVTRLPTSEPAIGQPTTAVPGASAAESAATGATATASRTTASRATDSAHRAVGVQPRVARKAPSTGTRTVGTAQLFALQPATSGAAFARSLGLKYRSHKVVVALSDDRFEAAEVAWGKDRRHATALVLVLKAKSAPFEAALMKALGPRFSAKPAGGRELALAGTSVRLSADGLRLEALVLPATDADWRKRLGALWSVVGAAARGQEMVLSRETRELIYRGFRIKDLVALELATFTRGAMDSPARPPGMARVDGEHFVVPLDNPWFKMALLQYGGRADNRLTGVNVKSWSAPMAAQLVARQMTCLSAAFGPPQVDVHQGLPRYRWTPSGLVGITLTALRFVVAVDKAGGEAPRATQGSWGKLWKATATCSGETLE